MWEIQINKVGLNLVNFFFFMVAIITLIFAQLINMNAGEACMSFCDKMYGTNETYYSIGQCGCRVRAGGTTNFILRNFTFDEMYPCGLNGTR